MKKASFAAALLLLALVPALPSFAQKTVKAEEGLRKMIRGSIEALSSVYAQAHGNLTVKRAVAIEFEAVDDKDKGLASTISSYAEEELTRSLIFFIVDRKNIELALEEMELAMSGLFDAESAPRLGELKAAQALILGKVSRDGESLNVSMKILDVETGAISAAASFDVSRKDLSAAAAELQYRFVAANGIGLTGSSGSLPYATEVFNRAITAPFELGVNYRPDRNWMVSGALISRFSTTDSDARYADDWHTNPGFVYSSFQPGATYSGQGPDSVNAMNGGDWGVRNPMVIADFDYLLIGLSGQFTLNVAPWFNVGLQGGPLFYAYEPRMSVTYGSGSLGGIFYRQKYYDPAANAGAGGYDYHPGLDSKPIDYVFNSPGFAGARAEIRPEFFITPRLAVALRLGYLWTLPLSVGEVNTSYARWTFRPYQTGVDSGTWTVDSGAASTSDGGYVYPGAGTQDKDDNVDQGASWLYYGWNPLLRPDGGRWIFDASRAYVMVAVTVYF